jgi:hypothetical protein
MATVLIAGVPAGQAVGAALGSWSRASVLARDEAWRAHQVLGVPERLVVAAYARIAQRAFVATVADASAVSCPGAIACALAVSIADAARVQRTGCALWSKVAFWAAHLTSKTYNKTL